MAITAHLSGGLALGFLKPYLLQVQDANSKNRTIKYSDDSTLFLSQGNIIGGAGFTKGWKDVKLKPGAFLKAALRFDFGRYNERVQALEIGMSVDGYGEKIPIMIFNDPKQVFFQGHIAFVFGGRK